MGKNLKYLNVIPYIYEANPPVGLIVEVGWTKESNTSRKSKTI